MRNWLPLCFAAAALVAAPVQAQYIYLDLNGDEFCDTQDHLPIDEWKADVWLDTTHDINGFSVTCASGQDLTVSGYQIVFKVGSPVDAEWTNARPEFTVPIGFFSENPYLYAGYTSPGNSTHLAPGRYKLGSLSAPSSTPCSWLAIVASAVFSEGNRLTEFSSQCLGIGGEYRQRLGIEFTDACATSVVCDPIGTDATTWGKIKALYRDK